MKITICGSMAFWTEMLNIQTELKKIGHTVKLPPSKLNDENGNPISATKYYKLRKAENNDKSWIWDRKRQAILTHFAKIEWCNAIIVLNYKKNNIEGYIGANTLIEMGIALYLNKPIYLLNNIPEISYKEEILGMKPTVINNDLIKIK